MSASDKRGGRITVERDGKHLVVELLGGGSEGLGRRGAAGRSHGGGSGGGGNSAATSRATELIRVVGARLVEERAGLLHEPERPWNTGTDALPDCRRCGAKATPGTIGAILCMNDVGIIREPHAVRLNAWRSELDEERRKRTVGFGVISEPIARLLNALKAIRK